MVRGIVLSGVFAVCFAWCQAVHALSIELDDDDEEVPPPAKPAKVVTPPKVLLDEVEGCIKNLGAKSFKDRRKASKRLVEIGKTVTLKSNEATFPYRAWLRKTLRPYFYNADPEVAGRAREVVRKLYPYGDVDPKKIEFVKHVVRSGDTIKDLADDYDSDVEWIQSANPGLQNDTQLHSRGVVIIPRVKDSDDGMIIEIE